MKRIVYLLLAVAAVAVLFASTGATSGRSDGGADPIVTGTLAPGSRDWRLVSVAREEGQLDDIRAILGNDVAIQAYRQATRPFPEGTVIARIAWAYDASEVNNKVFGARQSFVAGEPQKGGEVIGKGA